jgi:hypothetical protein
MKWLLASVLSAGLLVTAQPCLAQESTPMPGYLRTATIAAGISAGADWATTYHSLTNYRTFETNPLLRPFQEHPVDMVIVGSVIDVGTVYAWNRFVGRKHPKIATVGLWAMVGFRGYLAARNMRIEQWATPKP